MKYTALLFIASMALSFSACSLDEQLKPSDDLHVIVMESADTVRPLPGDTIQFKILASTNSGYLERLEIIDKTFDFDVIPEDITFSMVDISKDTLYLDENGYFSRPVKTVMILYPFAVPKDYSMVGDVLGMTFQVSNDQGKTATVTSCFKVGNTQKRTLFSIRNGYFYGCVNNRSYQTTDSTFIKNKENIDLLGYWDETTSKFNLLSPTSDKAVEVMTDLLANSNIEYVRDSMLTTTFIPCSIPFDSFNDNHYDRLDFSQGTDVIEVEADDVIAYRNSLGRRCVLHFTYTSAISTSVYAKHEYIISGE